MLSAEIVYGPDGTVSEEVELYLDRDGAEYLVYRLNHILEGKTDHLHMMTESWGQGDLDEVTHKPNNKVAHHLRITLI